MSCFSTTSKVLTGVVGTAVDVSVGPGPYRVHNISYSVAALGVAINYLQIFNLPASGVTVGTTLPYHVIPITGDTSLGNYAVNVMYEAGLYMPGTGFSVAVTTTPTGAVAGASATVVAVFGS